MPSIIYRLLGRATAWGIRPLGPSISVAKPYLNHASNACKSAMQFMAQMRIVLFLIQRGLLHCLIAFRWAS